MSRGVFCLTLARDPVVVVSFSSCIGDEGLLGKSAANGFLPWNSKCGGDLADLGGLVIYHHLYATMNGPPDHGLVEAALGHSGKIALGLGPVN